jgi:hypothetical protein
LTTAEVVVLRFDERRVPRPLAALPTVPVADTADIDAAAADARRLIVVGSGADLATVLTRLLRTEKLSVEVGFAPRSRGARRARTGPARRVPLIRDETGTVLVDAALWLPPDGAATIRGEAVVDDTVLFDGDVPGVRIEPMSAMPGLRAAVTGKGRRRWVTGRAAQLGTPAALVIRDGRPGPRQVKRSTFYRHTEGWLQV